ncbi:YdcF family protein [Rhodanobacter umsongensis]|uniref:YdcF family protein n=1 Tax=Rhodanobacter umsongensis TaxID=633153 RepID=UPI003671F56C
MVALLLAVCSTPAFAQWLRRGLTDPYPAQPAAGYPRTDAIVVLGGGWMPDAEDVLDNPSADDAHTRLGFGRRLYVAGRAPVVLLSGGDGEAQRMAARLALQGLPPARLWIEGRSRDTHENAVYSAQMLRRAGARRILLVTSAIHMGRAAASFRKQGVEVIPAPAMPLPHRDRPTRFWRGRAIALLRSANYLHEYLGQWIYRLRGWS